MWYNILVVLATLKSIINMENNNSSAKWVWVVVVVVVIVGLILIAQRSGQPAASDMTNAKPGGSANTTSKATGSTGQTVPPTVNTKQTATKNIVQLTSAGFKPFMLEIKRGESVEFINASNDAMVIHSQTENSQNTYPGFSQESGPLGRGGKFYFAFTMPGAWPYYNLNSITGAKYQGVIVVK